MVLVKLAPAFGSDTVHVTVLGDGAFEVMVPVNEVDEAVAFDMATDEAFPFVVVHR
jgi:hypothetical protein